MKGNEEKCCSVLDSISQIGINCPMLRPRCCDMGQFAVFCPMSANQKANVVIALRAIECAIRYMQFILYEQSS